MTDLLPVTNDFVFAKLFGSETHKGVLIKLLNAILAGDPYIESIEFLPTEMKRETVNGKEIRLDIIGVTEKKQKIHIEMQCSKHKNIPDRLHYYRNRIQFKDVKKGDEYITLPHVISIWLFKENVTDFEDCINEVRDTFQRTYMHDFQAVDDKSRIILIELQKIHNVAPHLRNTDFETWIRFIQDPLSVDLSQIPEIEEAFQELKDMSADEETRQLYESRQIILFDTESDLRAHFQDGVVVGKAEGKAEGRAEGKAEGRAEEKAEMVKNLLALNVPIEQISQASSLSVEEIKAL